MLSQIFNIDELIWFTRKYNLVMIIIYYLIEIDNEDFTNC